MNDKKWKNRPIRSASEYILSKKDKTADKRYESPVDNSQLSITAAMYVSYIQVWLTYLKLGMVLWHLLFVLTLGFPLHVYLWGWGELRWA